MKYEITKEQILELKSNSFYSKGVGNRLESWFPDVFKPKLEVGKWYKQHITNGTTMFLYNGKIGNKATVGFDVHGNWSEIGVHIDDDVIEPTTTQEVETALIAEAKKRGFKEGVLFLSPTMGIEGKCFSDRFTFTNGILYNNLVAVFNKGIWAEIIPTMTVKEAEEKLKCKIV